MKTLHLFSILSFLTFNIFTGQLAEEPQKTPSDADIRQKIVGTWIVDSQSPNGISIRGNVTIASNKTFISKATVIVSDKKQEMQYEGKWEIKDGYLIETITKSDSKLATVGAVTRDKINRVDDLQLVYQSEQGKYVTRKRG